MTKKEALRCRHKIERKLLEIQQRLECALLSEEEGAQMVNPDVQAILTAMDTATNQIAARIQALIDKQPALSADDKQAFQDEIDKLTEMGKDPANPVPTT